MHLASVLKCLWEMYWLSANVLFLVSDLPFSAEQVCVYWQVCGLQQYADADTLPVVPGREGHVWSSGEEH